MIYNKLITAILFRSTHKRTIATLLGSIFCLLLITGANIYNWNSAKDPRFTSVTAQANEPKNIAHETTKEISLPQPPAPLPESQKALSQSVTPQNTKPVVEPETPSSQPKRTIDIPTYEERHFITPEVACAQKLGAA